MTGGRGGRYYGTSGRVRTLFSPHFPKKQRYCLCQRVKPAGAPQSPFMSDKDFEDALRAHHAVLTRAMVAKQVTDVSGANALEHAVADWARMYLPDSRCVCEEGEGWRGMQTRCT